MEEAAMAHHETAEETVSPADQALGRLTSEAVRDGTGREWADWLDLLDAAGGPDWDHRGIIDHLEREHPEVSAWWRQSLAVGYERARGKRVVGQTADVGFQIGVQRSVEASAGRLWDVLTERPELWLGPGVAVSFEPGQAYDVPPGEGEPGARGEVRVVKPGDRLRMTWQPAGWPVPATVQVTLSPVAPGRTRLQAHLEKLPDAETREAMRERWRAALDRITQAAGE
jgi:uncharacterized protein YndB with AHSA1/START domain